MGSNEKCYQGNVSACLLNGTAILIKGGLANLITYVHISDGS